MERRQMDDLYNILGVSEDDIVVDVRYCLLYVLRKDILDLREDWVHRAIMERFRGYTHQNAIRLQRIAVAHDDCIVFDLQLVDPDVAIQQIVNDIADVLRKLLPWPHARAAEHPWREVQIVTIGAPGVPSKRSWRISRLCVAPRWTMMGSWTSHIAPKGPGGCEQIHSKGGSVWPIPISISSERRSNAVGHGSPVRKPKAMSMRSLRLTDVTQKSARKWCGITGRTRCRYR